MFRANGGQAASVATGGAAAPTGGVFNECEVRAAAGVTLVLGAVAFVYAYFGRFYLPIKVVTAFFAVEFLLRIALGLRYSPVGWIARLLTQRQRPHWVSARPKRFAWTLGLSMALAMTAITQADIHGALPLTICMICMTLMWLETALGFCLGCAIYLAIVRRGWLGVEARCETCLQSEYEPGRPAGRREVAG